MAKQINRPPGPWTDVACVGLSAAFLVLIVPGFDVPSLAWIALVPLLLLIRRSGPRRAFLASLAVGILFCLGRGWWAFRLDAFGPLSLGLTMLGNASYLAVFGLLAHHFQTRVPRWNALTLPATAVLLEYVRLHLGFAAFPWGILGYSQYSVLPVAQLAAYAGVYGVSFLIVTVNTVLADLIEPYLPGSDRETPGSRRTSLVTLAGALIAATAAFLAGSEARQGTPDQASLRVGLVQADVYSSGGNGSPSRREVFENYYRLTLSAAESAPDLIAWPSSSVPGSIPYDSALVGLLSGLAREADAYLLVGSSGQDKSDPSRRRPQIANSAFLLSPEGEFVGRYDKIRLLPFNEYLPLRGYLKWPSWIVSETVDAEPGKNWTVLRTDRASFGVLICWENLFPDEFRRMAAQGIDFMVSMTNEAFTDAPAAHYQMLAMNVFRAIENRVSIVRTATTGVSAIIAPSGQIVARVQDERSNDLDVLGYLVSEIPLSSDRTFYTRYGDWFVYLLAILFPFALLASIRRGRPPSDSTT